MKDLLENYYTFTIGSKIVYIAHQLIVYSQEGMLKPEVTFPIVNTKIEDTEKYISFDPDSNEKKHLSNAVFFVKYFDIEMFDRIRFPYYIYNVYKNIVATGTVRKYFIFIETGIDHIKNTVALLSEYGFVFPDTL